MKKYFLTSAFALGVIFSLSGNSYAAAETNTNASGNVGSFCFDVIGIPFCIG